MTLQKLTWTTELLKKATECWFRQQRLLKRKQIISDNSVWWDFVFKWSSGRVQKLLNQFESGEYSFQPMSQYVFKDECVRVWDYADRLILKLIVDIIKPVFKHIISWRCFHLQGPKAGVHGAIKLIQTAIQTGGSAVRY